MTSLLRDRLADLQAALPGRELSGLALAMLLAALGTSSVNIALPVLSEHFAASFQQAQWVVLAYLLSLTMLSLSAGRLGDMLGRAALLRGGVAVFGLASLAGALAPSLPLLIAARAAQGLGAALLMALALAQAGATAQPGRSGSAIGLLGAASALGTALGPTLGGLLLEGFGWRAIFLLNVPLAVLALLLIRSESGAQVSRAALELRRLDLPGSLLLAAGLGALTLALSSVKDSLSLGAAGLLLLSALALALFMQVEQRAAWPLLRPGLLSDPQLGRPLLASLLMSAALMASLLIGPFYLRGALGLGAALSGLVMSAGPLVVALSGVAAGRLVDRRGTLLASRSGLGLSILGAVLLALLPAALGIVGYLLPLMLLTLGYSLFQAANNTAVLKQAGAEQRGLAAGLLSLSRSLGLSSGAALMGMVFMLASGGSAAKGASAAALAQGLHACFALGAALLGLALWLTLGAAGQARTAGQRRLVDCPNC